MSAQDEYAERDQVILLRKLVNTLDGLLVVAIEGREQLKLLNAGLASWKTEWENANLIPPDTSAVRAVLTISTGDPNMSSSINIDTVGAVASLVFEDRLNEATSAPLSSDGVTPVVVAYTSDNPAVATVDATSGALTEVAAGTVNIGATVNDAITGAPALEASTTDPVTGVVTPGAPFAPVPQNITVNPGAAVGDVFTVTP